MWPVAALNQDGRRRVDRRERLLLPFDLPERPLERPAVGRRAREAFADARFRRGVTASPTDSAFAASVPNVEPIASATVFSSGCPAFCVSFDIVRFPSACLQAK